MVALLIAHRRALIVAFHACLAASTNYLAYLLLFGGAVPPSYVELYWQVLPWLLSIRLVSFAPFHLYQRMWRYTGMEDLASIVSAITLSTIAGFVLITFGLSLRCPVSVYLIDTLLLIITIGGSRTLRVVYYGLGRGIARERIVVFGAGDSGAMIVRAMKNSRTSKYFPVGLIDDNKAMKGRWIHGVKVLGSSTELEKIVKDKKADAVLLAIPGFAAARVREVLRRLGPFEITLKMLPIFNHFADSNLESEHLRDVSLCDLLSRKPFDLQSAPLERLIAGKRVLVTGAGGSIGSELCRQVAALKPAMLMMLDRYENALFDIENDLIATGHGERLDAAIGDISDSGRVDQIFHDFAPQIIFHAAAHKHVPLMERDVCEAVKNNVRGTRLLAEAAIRRRSDLMILISTDKAVNPASVMGATKRAAETIIQALAEESETKFATVRFGNVLGSNGSVVPRFMKQIAEGGPITITHPEMRRFFMLIPEAVQLVLHAAAIAESGAVYILEMGEQIKVLDLARNLIALAGLTVDKDIAIEFIGPRPGEKLSEELVGPGETAGLSSVPGVLRVTTSSRPDAAEARQKVAELEMAALRNESEQASTLLMELVTNYREPLHYTPEHQFVSGERITAIHQQNFGKRGKVKLPLQAGEHAPKSGRPWHN